MRALCGLVLLLTVLAPVGTFGITVAPSDTDQLTTARATTTGPSRRVLLDPEVAIAPAIASLVPGQPTIVPTPARRVVSADDPLARSSDSPRGPPR